MTEGEGIHIEWEPNIEDDLRGYRIYRSTSPTGGFERIDEVSPENTFYEDVGVKLETAFCYRVTAVDDDNNESTMSEPACYTLIRKPVLTAPPNQAILDAVPTFRWIGLSESGFYTVRVFVVGAEDSEPPLQEIWHYEIVDFDVFEVTYNTEGTATQALTADEEYRWRVDFDAEATVGAESNWRFFTSRHKWIVGVERVNRLILRSFMSRIQIFRTFPQDTIRNAWNVLHIVNLPTNTLFAGSP